MVSAKFGTAHDRLAERCRNENMSTSYTPDRMLKSYADTLACRPLAGNEGNEA